MVKNGWPPELAYAMDDEVRTARCIIYSEMEGSKFDWDAMEFVKEPTEG